MIHDNSLDVAVVTETWFNPDMPAAITDGLAPAGFKTMHCIREKRGGGISFVYKSG